MIPRTIAEPIFPAPIIPIFSFNIAVPPSPSIKARSQNKELKQELQSHLTPKTKGLQLTTEGPLRQLLLKSLPQLSIFCPELEGRARLGRRQGSRPRPRDISVPPLAFCPSWRRLLPGNDANRFFSASFVTLPRTIPRLCPTCSVWHRPRPIPNRA